MANLVKTISSISFAWPITFERIHHSPPYSLLYDYLQSYTQMTLFPETPKCLKVGILIVPKFWMFISSSNQNFLEHRTTITYSFQKYLSNGVLFAPIGNHLTPTLRGFVIGSQILNLTPDPSFDHNSCISSLNDQGEGTLDIFTLRPFQWYFGGPIWCFFVFSTKALNIRDSCKSATPKMGVHLGIIGFNLL